MSNPSHDPFIRHAPSTGTGSPDVWGVHEPDTASIRYVCADPATGEAVLTGVVYHEPDVFDPERDVDRLFVDGDAFRIAEHRAHDVHGHDGAARENWIAHREKRGATLALPDRLLAARQIDLRGGRPPDVESDGRHCPKMALDRV